MNNLRLLTGCFAISLFVGGVCAYGQSVTTLEEIFEVSDSRSAQLRPLLTAEREAAQEISVARAGRLPDINASLSLSYLGDGFTTKRDFSDYQEAPNPHLGNGFTIEITQPVYTGGAVTSAIELAELKSTAARFATEMKRDNLKMQLTGYYLDIYKSVNLRKVIEGNIASAREVLKDMEARYEQGTALQNDITRYELLVSNLELQLVKINNTIDILNRNLVETAGFEEWRVIVPDSTLLERSLPREDVSWWQSEAEFNAPMLGIAKSGVEISRKSESIVKSERMPKVGLNLGWTLTGPILEEVPPIDRNLSYWYVGVGVSYNLSSLYKSNRKMSKARESTRRAIEELDAAREDVRLAVNADYVRYLEAYEELKTQQKSVELAERNYNTTYMRYSADMALITDMLDAVNARINAEQELVNARINIIYYYYKLLFTTGKI